MHYSSLLPLLFALPFPHHVYAFPQYGSLAGLTAKQLALVLPTLHPRSFTPPPDPLNDTSVKLVNDQQHPYIPPGLDDIRGPCPAMNTLANHGYIPRNGIARPSQIVAAVQEAFNMGNDVAISVVYGNFVFNGNLITDLMSIGQKTSRTGVDPGPPCEVGGLSDHNTFEGDTSMTRADLYFGDNHSFNETYFQAFIRASSKSPDGKYDPQVAIDLRNERFKDSIATNPEFNFPDPRYFGAFSEAIFPYALFVDGRFTPERLDMDAARSFFEFGKMPDDFHRGRPLSAAKHNQQIVDFMRACPEIKAGKNNGTVNSFIPNTGSPGMEFEDMCVGYTQFIDLIAQIYQNVAGDLRNAIRTNIHYFHRAFVAGNCTELFPFGKLE